LWWRRIGRKHLIRICYPFSSKGESSLILFSSGFVTVRFFTDVPLETNEIHNKNDNLVKHNQTNTVVIV